MSVRLAAVRSSALSTKQRAIPRPGPCPLPSSRSLCISKAASALPTGWAHLGHGDVGETASAVRRGLLRGQGPKRRGLKTGTYRRPRVPRGPHEAWNSGAALGKRETGVGVSEETEGDGSGHEAENTWLRDAHRVLPDALSFVCASAEPMATAGERADAQTQQEPRGSQESCARTTPITQLF